MKCWTVDRRLSAYLEDGVSEPERLQLSSHLRECAECTNKMQSQRQVRGTLQSLGRLPVPEDLTLQLRVMASKERLIDRTPGGRWRQWRDHARLTLHDLMKPFAIPAAGGLCAAILLFSTLVPDFTINRKMVDDVPLSELSPSTAPVLKSLAPIGFSDGEAEVDLRIDERGRLINYSIVGGGGREQDALRRSIENNLLFTTFTPATAYGVPTRGTLRLTFRSSRIEVKG